MNMKENENWINKTVNIMLGRFRSAIYSAIGTEIESGTPAVPGSGSVDAGRVGKVSENMSSY